MIKQLRLQLDSLIIKAILLSGFLLSLFLSSPARAENSLQYIQSLQPIPFSQGGAALIPGQVLSSLTSGAISPVAQYVLVNHLMSSAIKEAIKKAPGSRLPYVQAKTLFEKGICSLTKTFQTGLVVALMPQMSSIRQNGGSNDPGVRQAKQAQALAMAQAFAGAEGCDGNSNDSGFDTAIIAILQNI